MGEEEVSQELLQQKQQLHLRMEDGPPQLSVNGDVIHEEDDVILRRDVRHGDEISLHEVTTPEGEEGEPIRIDPPKPPDGGWGWAVVFGAFITGVLVDGCAFTFGIIMIDMAGYYNVSKMSISWAGSVMNGVYLTAGPLVSGLCNKFGCRPIAFIGAIIASVGFFTCIFSPSVEILILLYGFVGGFGFGMLYLPSIVMVGFYFEKKRAFATGMAVCGSGMGAFIMAPVVETLLDVYEWRGAQIVLSGVILNGLVVAMLFRPLEDDETTISDSSDSDPESSVKDDSDVVQVEQDIEPHHHRARRRTLSITVSPPEESQNKYVTSLNQLYEPKRRQRSATECERDDMRVIRTDFVKSCDETMFRRLDANSQVSIVDKDRLRHELTRPMSRKDIFYTGSVLNLPEFKVKHSIDEYHRSVMVIPGAQLEQSTERGRCSAFGDRLQAITVAVLSMVDLSLLKSYTFLLYGISCFLTMAGFFVPFMFLPDDAMSKGLSRNNAALLLSIIGAANTIGRIACGWVSDQPWANSLIINNSALVMGGVATIFVPFFDGNFPALCVYCIVFGLSIAIFVSLRSIIMVELIGLEKLTSAFGMVTLCQGMSSFIGAPLAGSIYDATGDYSISFYFAGVVLLLGGLVCIPCRRVAEYEKRKQEEKAKNRRT